MDDVQRQFHIAMVQVNEAAKRDTGYNATRFVQMVAEQGGLATAKKLLLAPQVSDVFPALWGRGRLDLAVEAVVQRDEFAARFDDDERELPCGCPIRG